MVLTSRSGTVAAGLAAGISAILLAACGGGPETSEPSLVATTSVWADITSQVACGAPVAGLVPAGADPHTYEASLRDRELLGRATLVVANGAGLEATTHDLLDAVAADGVNVLEVATHVDLLADDHDTDHDDDHDTDQDEDAGDDHGHGEGDPHFWQDPTRVAGALDVIASALEAAGLPTCADDYREQLLALDAEVATILAGVPTDGRVLVTNHDSLAYFADRYGFEVIGTVIPSTSTLAEPSAGGLAELAELVEDRSVRAIFVEAGESSADAEALAERLGVAVVPLVTGALTDEAATYADMMRTNATVIATALTP
jgi:zinc/manganese transport system substrate-binding protein